MRKLFVKSMCQFCRKTLIPIEEINNEIPINKRIDIEDCYGWEHFKMKTIPVMDKLPFDGYPTLFIDNIKITGFLTKDQVRAFLDGFLKKEKIVEG